MLRVTACRLSVASSGSLRLSFASLTRTYATAQNVPVPSKSKVWDSADEAVKDIKSGSTILSGGMSSFTHPISFVDFRLFIKPQALVCVVHLVCSLVLCLQHLISYLLSQDSLIQAIAKRKEVTHLTAVSNNAGIGTKGLGACDLTL